MLGELILMMIIAFIAVLGIVVMMARINLRLFLGYPNTVDILCTVVFTLLFHGTFSGMVVAAFSSIVMSGMLWALRNSIGAQKLRVIRDGLKYKFEVYESNVRKPHWLSVLFGMQRCA